MAEVFCETCSRLLGDDRWYTAPVQCAQCEETDPVLTPTVGDSSPSTPEPSTTDVAPLPESTSPEPVAGDEISNG